jgi:putative hydrolase of the HAD superfamily
MIHHIIFDMGQVLLYFRPDSFLDRYDLTTTERELLKREVFQSMEWTLLDWGKMTDEEALKEICKRLPAHLHPIAGELVTMWDRPIEPIPGMAELVEELKNAGYGIYLLSNASLRHKEYWQRVPGHELFDGLVVSAFEQKIKPDPAIYQCLLDRYGLKGEECLFIDDSPINIAGAYLAGISGIVFHGPEDLRRQLETRKVLIPEFFS